VLGHLNDKSHSDRAAAGREDNPRDSSNQDEAHTAANHKLVANLLKMFNRAAS
jgi:hypothetical protein